MHLTTRSHPYLPNAQKGCPQIILSTQKVRQTMQNQRKQHLGKTHIPEKQLEIYKETVFFFVSGKWVLKILEEKGGCCKRRSNEEAKPLRKVGERERRERERMIKRWVWWNVDCHGPSPLSQFFYKLN